MSLQYDEFSDLLGGAPWGEAFDRWCHSGLSVGRQQNLRAFSTYFSSPHQFLFSEDPQRYPLEVFWLKWNLFTKLCRRIQRIHQEHQRPLLNLQPGHLRVQMAEATEDFLPSRWAFSLDTSNLQLADRFIPPNMPADVPAQLFAPPADAHPHYTRVLTNRQGMEQKEVATLLIRSMERMRESQTGEARGIIQAQLVSENLRPSDFSQTDTFLVTLYLPDVEAEPLRIWAGKRASAERGVLLEGMTEPLSLPLWEQFERGRQKVFSLSKVVIYKSLYIPYDFYSLGMILFRTLLVNDLQEMDAVHQAVGRIAEPLGSIFSSSDPQENRRLSKRLRFYFRKEGETFSKRAIFYRQQEREKGCESVPDELWTEALSIGFRLIQNQSENGPDPLEGLMERIAADAEQLSGQIKMELFGSRQRNREILEACDLVRKELSEV